MLLDSRPLEAPHGSAGRIRFRLRDEDWQPMQFGATTLPGYHWIPLESDSAGAWHAYWMKVDPGARSPLHVHPSSELIQICQGVLCDQDGARFRSGDVVVYRSDTRHFTYSEEGCVVLVIASVQAEVPAGPD